MITFLATDFGALITVDKTQFSIGKAEGSSVLLKSTPDDVPTSSILSWPGEYDIDGIQLKGIGQLEGKKVTWLIVGDSVRIAYPAHPLEHFDESAIQALGDIDVLILKADESKDLTSLIEECDPRIILLIPGEKGFSSEVQKACGVIGKESITEYKLKGSLPAEGREVILLGKE